VIGIRAEPHSGQNESTFPPLLVGAGGGGGGGDSEREEVGLETGLDGLETGLDGGVEEGFDGGAEEGAVEIGADAVLETVEGTGTLFGALHETQNTLLEGQSTPHFPHLYFMTVVTVVGGVVGGVFFVGGGLLFVTTEAILTGAG